MIRANLTSPVSLTSPISLILQHRRIQVMLSIPAKLLTQMKPPIPAMFLTLVTLQTVQPLRVARPRPLLRALCDLLHCRTMNMALTGVPTTVPQRFFDASNSLFVQQAKGVIDVSAWQGTVDWQAVKNSGVEGAIIRIAYGWDNGFDNQALRNISECRRLGIPFGIYLYSYAYDANTGAAEGSSLVNLLQKAGVSSSDLGYPVYYDLERWTWTGHEVPNDPGTYDGIVNAWYGRLQSAGYNNLAVYSYTSYLNTALNSGNIHSKTRWVAQYGSSMGYTAFPTNDRGWQYTSKGRVNGISGTVDLSAFGNKTSTAPVGATGSVYRLYHPGIRVHHYTADAHEMSVLVNQRGWVYEGIMFKTPTSGQPVYRLYHPGIKQHVFTLSQHERNVLSKQRGWIYEGVAWHSNPNGGTAVYRLYNGSNYEHFYTSNRNEYNIRGSQGWTKEGIAWRS
ncbi:Glycosyl hydrolases family 25,lysozyme [Bifidobacterium breve 31L]|nr:Glycosyl hydrolases family 25,lysozyme [Bifidobacterium breve 31L]